MKKAAVALMIYLMIFALMFALSWYDLIVGIPLFPLGLSAEISNKIVMVLSFFGIVKTTFHIFMLGRSHKLSLI